MAARRTALPPALLLLLLLPQRAAAGDPGRPAPDAQRSLPRSARSVPRSVPDTAAERPNVSPTLADFLAALTPHGAWSDHAKYGPVWRPAVSDPDWAPYFRGHWTHTGAGWYWVSVEPWAWATYHYGRWFLDAAWGWTWVPGRRWAPAWVSWREGKGLAGWAPLQPDGAAHPLTYVFVESRRLTDPAETATLPATRGGAALRATRLIEAPGDSSGRPTARAR